MNPQTSPGSMTRYNLDTPDDVWDAWKTTVPRSYDKLGDRITELLEADARCHAQHGRGLVEVLADSEYTLDEGGDDA